MFAHNLLVYLYLDNKMCTVLLHWCERCKKSNKNVYYYLIGSLDFRFCFLFLRERERAHEHKGGWWEADGEGKRDS